MKNELPRLGIWRHYKGLLYQMTGAAHDADQAGREVVVYNALVLDAAHEGLRTAVRTVGTWQEEVCAEGWCPHFGDAWPLTAEVPGCDEGCPPCPDEGHMRPRFRFLGERWTARMGGTGGS